MDVYYAIKRNGKWLQGIEPNANYCKTATAPTMGTRHTFCEYRTIWGAEQKSFERLTAANYIKTLFEEYRWRDKQPSDIKIVPILK